MKYTKDYGDFVNEGTWSYGSKMSMVKLAKELEKAAKKAEDADDLLGQLEGLEKKIYAIAGDDNVFDQFDTAKANAEAKDLEGAKTSTYDTVAAIMNLMTQVHESEEVDEKLVKPSRGHNYYVLSKDVPVKYIVSQSNPTGATGVLLHNKKGYIDGKKGAYIIDYYGGHYYVDMENQFASPIYKLKDQDRGFRDALTDVDEAPQHADWREFMREIPFENNNDNMKHLKGYDGFLNEAKFDVKKFRKEAEAIPFEEWVVDWEHGETDGYYYVAAEWKGKYYLQWGAVVSPGEDLEDIDFSEEGEYITKKEYENIAY
jgi:hypothetical protein